jgi:predicted phage terminase large subunit-like protein
MKLNPKSEDLVAAVCRLSFGAFVYRAFSEVNPGRTLDQSDHIDAVCYVLQQMVEGRRGTRLVLNQPPRSLKSFITAVCLPAWVLGRDPSRAIIVASYAGGLSSKLSRDCRMLVDCPFFRKLFPSFKMGAKDTETEFETTQNGGRVTSSIDGTLTGKGADLFIIDDPMKAQDAYSENERKKGLEWFNSAAFTRRNSTRESLVIVTMQRLHEDDLSGHLIRNGWPALVLPAVATKRQTYQLGGGETYVRKPGDLLQPLRDSLASLEETKDQLGTAFFAAQYQQDPVPALGNIVKRSDLAYYDQLPRFDGRAQFFLTCDPASKPGQKNDYTAIVAAAIIDNYLYVLECARGHWTMMEMRRRIESLAARYGANLVIVEDTAIGPGLIQDLRANTRLAVLAKTPKGDKESRLWRQLALFEGRRVLFPKDRPWSGDFEREILGFPSTAHDDQVDALVMALERFGMMQGNTQPFTHVMPITFPWGPRSPF